MAKVRNDNLDIAKGFGILLVVMGHTLSPFMDSYPIVKWLCLIIYTFHMPLFFFVSGYVATKLVTKPISRMELFKQRVIRLIIPYLTWAVIYLPMKMIMSEHVRFTDEYKWYSFFLGNNPNGQLWFLYVLFIISIIIIFFVNEKNITAFTVIFLIGSFFAPLIPFSVGFTSITLNFSLYQVGFFFLGTLVALRFDYNKITQNTIAFIVSIIVFAAYTVLLWINMEQIWFLKAIAAACGIYIFLYLSALINKSKLKRPLVFLGKKSMEIYVLHGPLLVVGRIILPKIISNTGVYVIVMAVFAISVSMLASFIINKIKIARLLLFGSN